ncbi:MAG: hypothetical protein M3Z57_02665 [Candidatus Dormibacteraeota bacterium]|nr:hypothetical protein [Candidatus Dormibacteraeota bacterium]
MAERDIPEGYPDSAREDTTPPGPVESLEDADRELESEGEVSPQGAQPDLGDSEDAFSDAPDADQLAALEVGNQGSRPEDAANFEDNAAEWSRERD